MLVAFLAINFFTAPPVVVGSLREIVYSCVYCDAIRVFRIASV